MKIEQKQNIFNLGIFVTWKCTGSCDNCLSLCGTYQAPSKEDMSLDQIQKLIDQSVELNYQWKMWALGGGEPSCHPQIKTIIEMLAKYKNSHNPLLNLVLSSNGYGDKAKEIISYAQKNGFNIANSQKDYNNLKICKI